MSIYVHNYDLVLDYFLKLKKRLGRSGSGQFSALLHGAGVDLAESRQYSPGDEKRSINRKLSAKYDKMFVNLFHDEKALDVHLCCDVNYNWRHHTEEHRGTLRGEDRGKIEHPTSNIENQQLFISFFAELTSYFHEKKAHVTGRISDQQFLSLEKIGYQKNFLEACEKTIHKTLPTYHSSLSLLLARQCAIAKRRLIIIVSDFLDYHEEEKRQVTMLRQKHEVILFCIPTDVQMNSPEMVGMEVFH